MKKILLVILVILVFSSIAYAIDKSYSLNLKYTQGAFVVEKLELLNGAAPDRNIQPEIGYKAEVVSFKGDILYSFKFSFSGRVSSVAPDGTFDEEGNQISFPELLYRNLEGKALMLIVPYYPNASHINIYNPEGKLITRVDVSKFAEAAGKEPSKAPVKKKGFFENYKYETITVILAFAIVLAFLSLSALKRKK